MGHSKTLMHVFNSLELNLHMCGTTILSMKTHSKFFSLIHSKPFVLVTQITDGPLLIRLADATYRIEPGQALIVPAHMKYTLQLVGDEAVTHWLNMSYTLFGHFSVFDFIEAPITTSVAVGDKIGKLQAEIVDLMQVNDVDNSSALLTAAKVKQQLFAVLEIILTISRYKAGSFENMNRFQRFNPVFNYIEEHIAEKIKVSQLAKLMYVSTSHFHKEFQESFDRSPMQYIQTQRLKKAQYLLATSASTVREIAGMVGYDNAFTFIRFFKSMYGASPGNYRKMMNESGANKIE